jgi:hypothetical protein
MPERTRELELLSVCYHVTEREQTRTPVFVIASD